ncbi:beta-galactosidase GalB [Crateriforma conspicua]|uniref:Beta-galactosidase n=1 Tax=Crateriforma conspicua TaxID=2527996 RepID=A0A5C6FQE4_9PLAN|nr:beta-galactosidase GalB [Crateriforma conspicua]TWU62716.1 Beta-galactosidase [Crateriforma conspicua]
MRQSSGFQFRVYRRWRLPLLVSACMVLMASIVSAENLQRMGRESFNNDWRFHRGAAENAQNAQYDDASWRQLRLPHDWAIEGPFDIQYNARCGGLPFHGIGWYRKSFTLPESDRGKHISVEFDGAMYNAEVWLNGHKVGQRPFGYMGFVCDLTGHVNFGDEANVIAVRLAPEDLSSRWYPGAGIYRNVWLDRKSSMHVDHWGTSITTPTVTAEQAVVAIETSIRCSDAGNCTGALETTILDATGQSIAQSTQSIEGKPEKAVTVSTELNVDQPKLWDINQPNLYHAVSKIVSADGEVLDRYVTRFGIRTIDFSAENGFVLNGKSVKFKGVCLHHDLGPLGAAVNRRATMRQLEIMQSMGVNAIRTSHNPPSPEQLECCDELGLVVMDESFDVWQIAKVENGYNKFFDEWSERDLRDMILRDRNHPSVIMWSIGNEILEQGRKDGWKQARRLTEICHDQDATRPVAAGFNYYPGAEVNGLAAEVDVVGWNYKPMRYQEVTENHPDWIMCGSETSSCVSTRGEYHFPLVKYDTHPSKQVTSYDFIGPVWAYPPDFEFQSLEENPNILGEFVWTGFDYLGEPTPYGGRDNSTNGYWNGDWPVRSSFFGIVDLCGFPKDRFYLYQSQWTDTPMVHILPHWTWPERIGKDTPVVCYTNCDEVELIVNGESQGRKARFSDPVTLPMSAKVVPEQTYDSKYRLQWVVPYQPGSIEVVGYVDGKSVSHKKFVTASDPKQIQLSADRSEIAADGMDLSFVTVQIQDGEGNFCPRANNLVKFSIEGPAEIAAVGNGNPASTEPFQADQRYAFNGLCMLIVRSKADTAGDIKITATSEGLDPSTLTLHSTRND